MEPSFPLRVRTFVVLVATALTALVVCAQAGAWGTPAQAGVVKPGQSFGPESFTFQPEDSGAMGITCNADAAMDTQCGHFFVILPVAGTITADLTYPSGGGLNLITLRLCHTNQPGPVVGDCPINSQTVATADQEVPCMTAVREDPVAGTTTFSISCVVGDDPAKEPYDLLVVPQSIFGDCDFADPTCLPGPVTATLTGSFAGLDPTPTPVVGKVRAYGDVSPTQKFMAYGSNDVNRKQRAKLFFGNHTKDITRCKFESKDNTVVTVTPNSNGRGGTATFKGTGVVTNWQGVKTTVEYTARFVDAGDKRGAGDQFQLIAPGCDNALGTGVVTKGKVDIRAEHQRHGHEDWDD
jgi:hypothetical protein